MTTKSKISEKNYDSRNTIETQYLLHITVIIFFKEVKFIADDMSKNETIINFPTLMLPALNKNAHYIDCTKYVKLKRIRKGVACI